MDVATLSLAESRASLATECDIGHNRASTALTTSTTGLGASAPRAEPTDRAVDRATVSVAALSLAKRWAGVSTMLGVSGDGATARLAASATGPVTGRPSSPSRYLAVNWAWALIAALYLTGGTANSTAVSGCRCDGAGTGLAAGSTSDTASTPGVPVRQYTVHGACLGIAFASGSQSRAFLPAIGSGDVHTPKLGLETGATGLRALVIRTPGADNAIDWARVGIAPLRVSELGASSTTVSVGIEDTTSPGLESGAT